MNPPTDSLRWQALDTYFAQTLHLSDAQLDDALARARDAGLPAHEVAPNQAKLLQLFARMCGARRILEIGTLGGYSALCMARALPPGGELITLEADALRASVARETFRATGMSGCITLIEGDARETLAALARVGTAPFDMVFIDADKADNLVYLRLVMPLLRRGSVIVADNIARAGRLADAAAADDADVRGAHAFFTEAARDLRLDITALQTVGEKGWDGFALAVVTA
ncbi:O-methyltransferase [Bordetella genomosp. 5]|uniref:Methyltransferase n=1 Tax=Bordetella genomosp. 5 TaxID=1395608 RepID=A0A261TYZ8_9BORD|nr:O-methyltransferase [Bordetella genomosp. 5]OZI54906.1 hypothetical protein CAL25_00330 [Bordetella genomosp. 5]